MSKYRRPWWLPVNKPAGLMTTIHEESGPAERVFVIRGEPLVQGLAWLTWGPASALLVIIMLTGLSISLNIREQAGSARFLFVAAFLILPVLVWGAIAVITNRLAVKYLQAEREAETQECLIRLNQKRGAFVYKTPASSAEEKVPFEHIRGVKVAPVIGAHNVKSLQLKLTTDRGVIILLDEALGTQTQKIGLAHEIEASLKIRN